MAITQRFTGCALWRHNMWQAVRLPPWGLAALGTRGSCLRSRRAWSSRGLLAAARALSRRPFGLASLLWGCPKRCRDVAVNFSNNLHVDILWMLLIVNWLQEFMRARLPIFSCNLALALIANVLCINVLYYSCKCRLFYFCPNYLLLNFGKLFSGRYIRRSA